MADKTTGELLQDALNAGVRATLGDLKFELIALQAENGVLKARVAALETARTVVPVQATPDPYLPEAGIL